MLYKGMENVPGAPGNRVAGGNFMGGAGSAINPEAFRKDARQQKIYNKGMGTDNPNERQLFLEKSGPQLPMAGPGNIGGMMFAQAPTFYGDTINMGPSPGTYSNMPVIPDEVEEQIQREQMMEQFRNRAFPPKQIPVGFDAKYLT